MVIEIALVRDTDNLTAVPWRLEFLFHGLDECCPESILPNTRLSFGDVWIAHEVLEAVKKDGS